MIAGLLGTLIFVSFTSAAKPGTAKPSVVDLPAGAAPAPVAIPHFPDRLHAFVWRNWSLVTTARMAEVARAKPQDILRIGKAMGLPQPPRITKERQQRAYLTVIRRNWHLLPYEQLLKLLDFTPEQMAYTLREDDFLYVKLGLLKPKCDPIRYATPDAATAKREAEIARILREEIPGGLAEGPDPLFGFVKRLSRVPTTQRPDDPGFPRAPLVRARGTTRSRFSPRFCYSYFALYGDPLLNDSVDPYPDGYLAQMAARGVDGVWLQGVLYKLAPFPWDPHLSDRYAQRLANLRKLVARAKRHGISVYLYMNEPRAMQLDFFNDRPEMKGVAEGDYAALCTTDPKVGKYLTDSVDSICRAVPDLGGIFTITASENLTNCWSHHRGAECPRCGPRGPAEVIADVNRSLADGIARSGAKTKLIAWDWGWTDESAPGIIERLPQSAWLMSVSEWGLPIERGGVKSVVGEYSISAVGPGPRAAKHWNLARKRGMKTIAKVQAGCTWELSTVPYIPALENVARHAANLNASGVDGLMLGWTLGGYPSPNLEVMTAAGRSEGSRGRGGEGAIQATLLTVAEQRVGKKLAPILVSLWSACSTAFKEYPYHGAVVYNAPVQLGPANLLWERPTRYRATMVGFPYDDVDGWRGPYTSDELAVQMARVGDGFDTAVQAARTAAKRLGERESGERAFQEETLIAEACAIHFRSTTNQAQFVTERRSLEAAPTTAKARFSLRRLEHLLKVEMALAKRLFQLQQNDSRLGFEASNQYAFIPIDLAEKVINCRDLLDRWLPEQKARRGIR